ncbi:MAG: cell division protein FtsQ [Enterobacteriaceae bacterium]
MSQAAFNSREREAKASASGNRTNGVQLAGMIFLLLVSGTIVWGGWMVVRWMEDPHRLPLSQLVVSGERHYTTNDDIRRAIMSLGTPGTFMTQNVDIVQRQLQRMPWLRQVTVRKQWPDTLKIHVVEYVPVARWNDLQFIDAEGRTFSLPDERTGKLVLPMLYGPEGTGKEVLQEYGKVERKLATAHLRVKSITMSERRSWQLVLDNDLRVELGKHDQDLRLQRFMQVYPLLEQQGAQMHQRINYMDLRYDTGLAVDWQPVAEPATQMPE